MGEDNRVRPSLLLRVAAVYNVAFGVFAVAFPNVWFDLAGMSRPEPVALWQCIGMIVGVYGVGYWIAARDPDRHWPIVLVGLLGLVLAPLGFLLAALGGDWGWGAGGIILTTDRVWWRVFVFLRGRPRRAHGGVVRSAPG